MACYGVLTTPPPQAKIRPTQIDNPTRQKFFTPPPSPPVKANAQMEVGFKSSHQLISSVNTDDTIII